MFNVRCIARTIALGIALISLVTAQTSAQAPPLKIGVIMTFTGLSGITGQQLDQAINTFLAERGDTVAGRKVIVVKRDTGGPLADVAQREMQDLVVNEKVDFVIGTDFSPTTAALAAISTQAKKPVLVVNAAQTGLIDNYPYMTHFGFSIRQYEVPLARWAVKNGVKRVYMLYANFTPAQDGAGFVKETLTAGGVQIVGELAYPLSTTDFTPFAQRVKDAKPDAVWDFVIPGAQPRAMLKAFKEVGLLGSANPVKILDSGGMSDEPNLDAIGNDAIGVITAFCYSDVHRSTINRNFVQLFEKINPNTRPGYIAAIGYDAMSAIYKVVAAQNGNVDPDRSMALLRGMKLDGPRGPVEIDATTRLASQNIYIRRIERRGDHLVNVELETHPMQKH